VRPYKGDPETHPWGINGKLFSRRISLKLLKTILKLEEK